METRLKELCEFHDLAVPQNKTYTEQVRELNKENVENDGIYDYLEVLFYVSQIIPPQVNSLSQEISQQFLL